MRAWQVSRHGEPADVLELVDLPDPTPDTGQVCVAVGACALNFADTLLCRGTYQDTPPLPFVPGLELAGTVVASGEGVDLEPGRRVAGSPLLPHGALATHCLARAEDVFPLPESLGDRDAAAMHVTYQTAWFALYRRARLREHETVLVHAAAGGVGSAAVQIALAIGATVITTAGGPDKVAVCRELGAHVALDSSRDDLVDAVREATGGRGVDVVFDPVGGELFTASTRCVAWEGRIVVIGAAGGDYAPARTNHLMVKNYAVIGCNWGGYRTRAPELVRGAHDELVRLHRQGAIRPLIGAEVPLAGARDALLALAGRGTTGKVVVIP